jgi:glutaredoxin 3
MPEIIMYVKPGCPYCVRAGALLTRKGAPFREIIASEDPGMRAEMVARAHGRTTFPQIFIGGRHIGGCDDLHALDAAGGLDPLLQTA